MTALDRLRADVDSFQIKLWIAEHGVTRCPPGAAMGLSELERAMGRAPWSTGRFAERQRRAARNGVKRSKWRVGRGRNA